MPCQPFRRDLVIVGTIVVCLALVTSGCVTAPGAETGGTHLKRDQSLKPAFTEPSPERTVKVFFIREKGSIDANCSYSILVNGLAAFSIRNGEAQTIYVAPGQNSIGMQSGRRGCPNVAISQSSTFDQGSEATYRIFSPNPYGAILVRTK
jgi:hypothetical protein